MIKSIAKQYEKCCKFAFTKYNFVFPILKIGDFSDSFRPSENIIYINHHHKINNLKNFHSKKFTNKNMLNFILLHELSHSILHQLFSELIVPHKHHTKHFYKIAKSLFIPFKTDDIISKDKKLIYSN